MIRVAYITHTLGVGGAEEMLLNLVARLPRSRYEPMVCCFERPAGPMAAEIEAYGVTVTALGILPGFRHPLAIWPLVRYLRSRQPQVVHTFLLPASLYGRAAAVLARVPVIIGSEVNVYERKPRHHILAERLLASASHCVVASAESVKAAYVRQLGISPDVVRVVYNSVSWDTLQTTATSETIRDELGIPRGRVLFGVIATLQEKKGHRVLLEALAATPALADARLVVIGDGPLRGALEARARELGIGDRVVFCGTRRDLGNLLSAMDVFVLPSFWEGLPLVLLLALGAGRPVVATAIAGIPEVVRDGENGLLVPPGDVEALGLAMGRLGGDPEARRRFGERARAAVAGRFGVDYYVSAIAALYEEGLAA